MLRVHGEPNGHMCHIAAPVPLSVCDSRYLCHNGLICVASWVMLLGFPMFVCVCVFPRACPPTAHPSAAAPTPEFQEEVGQGEGEVGGDGSEEIEHLGPGLNGHVSPRASGCQVMNGVGAILHPSEHRAPAPSSKPPTLISGSSLQSTFPHSGLGLSYT